MTNAPSSRMLWALGGLVIVCTSLLGFWMGGRGRRTEGRTPRFSPSHTLNAPDPPMTDPAVASILRDILDELRALGKELGDSSTNGEGQSLERAARRDQAVLPPPDLSRLVNLRQWRKDRALRQRWFLLDRDDATASFGVPDKVNIVEGGTEIWLYRIEGGEDRIGLVFHHERLIDVIP